MAQASILMVVASISAIISLTQGSLCPMGISVCTCDVTKIDCSNLNLTSLPAHTGPGFSQTDLVIDDNAIDVLTAGGLPPGLRKFRSLGNPLTTISPLAFQGSENTLSDVTIEMSNMDFRQLSDALLPLTALTTLSLGHNNITNEFDNFVFPETLTHLFLDDNHMTRVPPAISGMPVIQEIDVSSNDIQELDSAVYPAALSDLYASDNDISYLPQLQFSGNSSLKILVLANNPVASMGELGSMSNLEMLNLEGSSLTHLPLELQSLPNLGELNLSSVDNLTCTCAEADLALWFKEVQSRRELHITGACEGVDIMYFLDQLAPQCVQAAPISQPIG